MVSDWMSNGNITEFVKANPGVNQLELVGPSSQVPRPSLHFDVDYQSNDHLSWEASPRG